MALRVGPATSLAPLLFLTTATMVLRHVGATTSTRVSCDWQACNDDPVCLECHSDFQYDECATNLLADYASTVSSDDCAYWSVYPCCHDEVSANDCLGNEAFMEYWLCTMSDLSYGVECTDITCSDFGGGGGGGGGDDESDVAAFTPAPTVSGGRAHTSSPNAGDADRSVPTADSSDTPSSSGDDGGDEEPKLAAATPTPAADVDSSSVPCVAETDACVDDEVCADCLTAIAADEQEIDLFGECVETYYENSVGDDLCTALSAAPCCTDEISTQDCIGNDQFVGYYLCIYSESFSELGEECTTFACGGLSGGGGSDDSGATVPTPAPTAPVAADTLSPQDTGGVGGGSDDSNPTVLTPAPPASVAADTSSPPDTGTTPAPSVAPLSTSSTSARDLDFTPSPTTEGGEESEAEPATTTGSSAPCASGPNTRMLVLIGTLTVVAHFLCK